MSTQASGSHRGHMPGKLKRSFGRGASRVRREHSSQRLEVKSHGRVIGRNRVARPALLLLLLPRPHPAGLLFQLFLDSWGLFDLLATPALPSSRPFPPRFGSLAARLRLRSGARPVLTLKSRSAGAQPGGQATEPQELWAKAVWPQQMAS